MCFGFVMKQTKTRLAQSPEKSTTRIQVDLPQKSMERLAALKSKTESSSYVEVVKNALRIYEDLINEFDNGKEFIIRDKEGVTSRYPIFGA